MGHVSRRDFLRTGSAAALGIGVSSAVGGWLTAAPALGAPGDDTKALKDLARQLNGPLLLPGDAAYDAASAPANGRYRMVRPAAVAQCADEADVVTCVKWSRKTGVPLVGRGGGHSYAGYSTTRGLLVDIGRLNSVTIDAANGIAIAGGAALNQNFYDATHDSPLFLPGGTCLGVGVGGLTLGGGIGYNTHWAGLTCDHLTASEIVTASGELLHIDDREHKDLFWACRGGAGGSFGINTSFTFELQEAPQSNVGWYKFTWTGADAAGAILAAFDEILQSAPAAFNAVAMAQATPVGDGGPRAAIDVMSRGQYIGPLAELGDLVAPLLSAAAPATQTLQEQTFWDTARMIASPEPESHSFGDVSRYANRPIPARAVEQVVDLLAECPSRSDDANGAFWSLGWVGGDVVSSKQRTDTAYVHRDATTLLRPTTVWPDDAPPSVGDDLNAWTDDVIAVLDPHTPRESYQNFPNRSIKDWKRQYYAENYPRLVDVKTKFDPDDLFRNKQSIPPKR
jgi:FAD/FMN-containing dehydrogenase